MRLPPIVTIILLLLLFACNTTASDKESAQPKPKPTLDPEGSEFKKLRKQQDSLLELRHQKPKKKGLDTLKPVQT